MRLTEKGQVTIPIDVRERLGLQPGDDVTFTMEGRSARLARTPGGRHRGRRVVQALRGRGDVALTTDEIMALTRGDD